MLRDNILIEQRFLLEKNSISNTISYNGLKVVNKIEEDMNQKPKDFVFPPINSHSGRSLADAKKQLQKTPGQKFGQQSKNANGGKNYFSNFLPTLGGKYRQGPAAVGNQAPNYQSLNRYRGNNKFGAPSQKRGGYELPDYLKSRVKVTNGNQNLNKPGSQHSSLSKKPDPMNDRALSYNRRLQVAIHAQNHQLYPGGYNSIDRSRSGHGGNRAGSRGGPVGG